MNMIWARWLPLVFYTLGIAGAVVALGITQWDWQSGKANFSGKVGLGLGLALVKLPIDVLDLFAKAWALTDSHLYMAIILGGQLRRLQECLKWLYLNTTKALRWLCGGILHCLEALKARMRQPEQSIDQADVETGRYSSG